MRSYLEIWCEPNKKVFEACREVGLKAERSETASGITCHSFYFASRTTYEVFKKVVQTLGEDLEAYGYRIFIEHDGRRDDIIQHVKADGEFNPLELDTYVEFVEGLNRVLEIVNEKIQQYEKRIKDLEDWAEGYRKERNEKLELLSKIAELVAPFMPPEED